MSELECEQTKKKNGLSSEDALCDVCRSFKFSQNAVAVRQAPLRVNVHERSRSNLFKLHWAPHRPPNIIGSLSALQRIRSCQCPQATYSLDSNLELEKLKSCYDTLSSSLCFREKNSTSSVCDFTRLLEWSPDPGLCDERTISSSLLPALTCGMLIGTGSQSRKTLVFYQY